MVTIMRLPHELIVIILSYNDISIGDIINFMCVFQQLFGAILCGNFWRQKLYQRWPSAKKLYDNQSKENEQKDSEENVQKEKESFNFIETGISCAEQLDNYVSQIIHKHYYDNDDYYDDSEFFPLFAYQKQKYLSFRDCYDDVGDNKATNKYYNNTIDNLILFEDVLSSINNFDEIISKPENLIKYFFFLDEIKHLLTQSQRNDCDLTKRYCYAKIFDYMRQCLVRKMWDIFEKQHDREQLLEQTATIVARWIQPQKDVFYSYVKASLDDIALKVLNYLRQIYPDHSIFSTSAETFSYWKNNNIDDNHWNEAEGKQIMDILDEYIFGTLNFQLSNSKDKNSQYMCIDNVLENKYGHEIILLIIYHSVARRLGLRCDVISMPKRSYTVPTYCILWKPKYATNSLENVACFSINDKSPYGLVNQHWTLYSTEHSRNVSVITAKLMWREMRDLFADLINKDNNILEIDPYDSRFYGLISRKIRLCFKKTVLLNRSRPEDVKFAVGMIVTHSDQSTGRCAGVIIGWHQHIDTYVKFEVSDSNLLCPPYFYKRCEMPFNHCDNFNFTKQQTNYIILSDNNKMCYVGEDAITLTTPKWINNSEIGRYFCKFEDTHYIPNKMLARFYPHDAAITAKITISENQKEE